MTSVQLHCNISNSTFNCMVSLANFGDHCNTTDLELHCDISNCTFNSAAAVSSINFSDQYNRTDLEKTITPECKCEPSISEPKVTSEFGYELNFDTCSSDSTTVATLGAALGLLLMLLAIVTTGWVWTYYWSVRGRKMNSDKPG